MGRRSKAQQKRDPMVMKSFMCPVSLWAYVEEESIKDDREYANIIRDSLIKRYELVGYRREKSIPIRFMHALRMFEVLEALMSDTAKYSYKDPLFISFPDVLYVLFGGWSKSKKSVSLFSRILSELKHPFQFQEVISEVLIAGTNKSKKNYDGFRIFFETPVTKEGIMKLEKKAISLLQEDNYDMKLIRHAGKELIETKESFSKKTILAAVRKGKGGQVNGDKVEEEGFATEGPS